MSKLIDGLIIRAYNSFYYVRADGYDKLLTCKLKGRFKQNRFSLLVGDKVRVELSKDGTGSIDQILERSSTLLRPAVANLEQVILVFAMRKPDYSLMLIDKLLALYGKANISIILCFNKCELAEESEQQSLKTIYERIGYHVLFVSAKQHIGIEELHNCLHNKISAFAGPSGVGKSSLLNAIQPGLALQTGEVSDKIGRGKHTTRYSQLMDLHTGGYIADTPGFSSVDSELFQEDNLSVLFKDIATLARSCRFTSCKHDQEPDCAVKEAYTDGELTDSRYENYLSILGEIKELKARKR